MAPADWRRPYTPGPLTPEECEQYWQDGYVIKKGLLTGADLTQALQAIDRWEALTIVLAFCSSVYLCSHELA